VTAAGGPSQLTFEVVAPHVAVLTLTRADRLNAYTPRMCQELLAGLARYDDDDELRVLVLTGEGRGFCAGGDVRGDDPDFAHAAGRQLGRGRELAEDMQAVVVRLLRLDKPVIAAINGVAVSGGLALALACDVRIAARSARLGDTAGRVGLLPDEGGAWLFPRQMGYDRAFLMVALAELYDAGRAFELGLVTEVVADADLRTRALELAGELAARAPLTVRVAKRLLRDGQAGGVEESMRDAQLAVMIVNTSADAREGLAAFREKRAPRFEGR
jgi:enoyl-CoA hydratase/carnithine racemase